MLSGPVLLNLEVRLMSPWAYTLRDDLTCRDMTIIAFHHHITRLGGALWKLWGAFYHKAKEHWSTIQEVPDEYSSVGGW